MDQNNLQPDLERARLMMRREKTDSKFPDLKSDIVSPEVSDLSSEDLTKERSEARKAMEGVERREERKRIEKILAEKENRQREIALIKKRRQLIEEAKAKEEEQTRELTLAEENQKTENYNKKVLESETEISRIKESTENLKPFHTLNSDIKQANTDVNLVRQAIQAKEVRLRQEQEKETRQKSGLLISTTTVVVSVLFVVVGLLIVYFGYSKFQNLSQGITIPTVSSLVLVEHQKNIEVDNKTPDEIFSAIDNQTRPTSEKESLTQFYFSKTTVDDAGQKQSSLITTDDFIALTNINLPVDFAHFLNQEFLVGAYSGADKSLSNFYVFTTRSFEHTFASLIKNEQAISFELFSRLMSAKQTDTLKTEVFTDDTIDNTDVRVLRDVTGEITLVYTFVDQNTLVFAESKPSLIKIINGFMSKKARQNNL